MRLLIITASIILSVGKLAYSKSSVEILMCDTQLYDTPLHENYIKLSKGTRYYYYGKRYKNWHNISSFTDDGRYAAGVVTTNNLLCK